MQSQMFKDVKAATAKDKKKGKKDAPEKKPATTGAQAKVAVAQRPEEVVGAKRGPQKKNRKDRRKEQRKDRRREIKKRVKEEKIKLQQEVVAGAS